MSDTPAGPAADATATAPASPTADATPRFPSGRLVRALAMEGQVRVLAAVAHGPARELCHRHGLTGGSARVGAEGLVAASLLSSSIKGEERITVEVQGARPAFAFAADVWAEGRLRARFRPPSLPPFRVFEGYLAAIRSLHGQERYRGVAEVPGETFEGALSRFLTQSDQVDGRVRIHVELGDDGQPVFAAGLLVERLPGMEPETFAEAFDVPLKQDFLDLMNGFAMGRLAHSEVEVLESRPLVFRCTCTEARVLGMLRALGSVELTDMLTEDDGAEVTCHFCNQPYQISADQLRGLIADLAEAAGPAS